MCDFYINYFLHFLLELLYSPNMGILKVALEMLQEQRLLFQILLLVIFVLTFYILLLLCK